VKLAAVGRSAFILCAVACSQESTTVDNVVATVEVSPAVATLGQSDTRQLTATAQNASGKTIEQASIQWSSSDAEIATVSITGVVTAQRDGSVKVRATSGGVSCSADVVVATVLRNVIIYTTEESALPAIAVVHPDGTGRRRVGTNQQSEAAPAISPDGKRIAYAGMQNGAWGIYIMKADGTGASVLIQRSSFDGSPAWSPDGSRLAFRSENPGQYGSYGRIFVINVDGTGLHQVSPESDPTYTYDDGPTWSPDGARIAFSRTGKLHLVNADGTGFTALVNPEGAEYPSWSPDGVRLAYKSLGSGDIYVRNADGSNPVRLTTAVEQEDMPRWSPDSRRLVFDRVINGVQLFLINADGTGEVRLSRGATSSDAWPNWSPLP